MFRSVGNVCVNVCKKVYCVCLLGLWQWVGGHVLMCIFVCLKDRNTIRVK